MKVILSAIVLLLPFVLSAQKAKYTIDFGDYYKSTFDAATCTYQIGTVPVTFIGFDEEDTLCTPLKKEDAWVYRAIINKKDIPLDAKNVKLTVVKKGRCDNLTKYIDYRFYYKDGTVVKKNGALAYIPNYDKLEYLEIFELECGLIGEYNRPKSSRGIKLEAVKAMEIQKYEINFGNYHKAIFDSVYCNYEVGGLPMLFVDVYQKDTLCASVENQTGSPYRAIIYNRDIPFSAPNAKLTVTQKGSCPNLIGFVTYTLIYQDGKVVKDTGKSILISNFNDLESIAVEEIECGIVGKAGDPKSALIIELERRK